MIVSWNIRGLNKAVKTKEVSFRLLTLNLMIVVLIKTRVKKDKSDKVRSKIKLRGSCIDNYQTHDNGKLWI
ncbi:unnamed protein product [Lathyrus sativus]|nr:unnamed protein product [Lathyrus sativus]